MYKTVCALIEDEDKSARRLHFADSNQTAEMRRLFWVFAGGTCNFVRNFMSRINYLTYNDGIVSIHHENMPI